MFARSLLTLLAVLLALTAGAAPAPTPAPPAPPPVLQNVALPKPDLIGRMTLERALAMRRSVREYAPTPLTLREVSQILWAAHGITGPEGKRTTPSARAVYPLQVWLVANDVTGLAPGIYCYSPADHALELVAAGDHRAAIAAAASGQKAVEQASAVVAVVGDSVLAAEKFHGRATAWLAMEAGFVVQNVYLEATATSLGTVMVGGFQDAAARQALGLPAKMVPLGFMPLGWRK
jgi:SagB-type dehydrogenase family enzyme